MNTSHSIYCSQDWLADFEAELLKLDELRVECDGMTDLAPEKWSS